MNSKMIKISKFLAFVLRHGGESIGLKLNKGGWANISDIIKLDTNVFKNVDGNLTNIIKAIVSTDDKQRYKISKDGKRIRANQGHSLMVDLGLKSQKPPDILYHGTVQRYVSGIIEDGIKKGQRQRVHLSINVTAALKVARRHGKNIVLLEVNSGDMWLKGFKFYLSDNGIWLTDIVPSLYVTIHWSK